MGDCYLINITRGSRQKYAGEFAASGFELLPGRAENQQVEVRKIPDPEDSDSTLVLWRSANRRLKEVAMISTAEQRFLKDSDRLQVRVSKGKLKGRGRGRGHNRYPNAWFTKRGLIFLITITHDLAASPTK